MDKMEAFDLSKQWLGGVIVKGANVQHVSRQETNRAPREDDQRAEIDSTVSRTVHLDADYTRASTHNLTQYDVTTHSTIMSRMSNAPQSVQDKIKASLEALERNKRNIDRFYALKEVALSAGNVEVAMKREAQLKQAALMDSAISEELRIAYVTGPKTTSFDTRNEYGARPRFRTDAEMMRELIEVTVGSSKPTAQLNDYMLAAQKTGKELYLHGPLLSESGKRLAEAYGFTIGQRYEDLFRFITRP